MVTVTESQFPPMGAQEGDIWIRLHGVGIRQRYEFMLDKTSAAQPAANGWVGYMPQAGGIGLHLAKFGGAVAHYQGQWVEARQGLASVFHFPDPLLTWTIPNHQLAFRFVDITTIRAQDDWTYNAATESWTDPQIATRPVTIMMPRQTLATATGVLLSFAEPVRGVALVRR
jgi:hypothetical protein